MRPGTFDLLILNNNNKLNKRGRSLREEINQLEKLYKK